MAWWITCSDGDCNERTRARDIPDLIGHRDAEGWFVCACGKRGYVARSFSRQEGGDRWTSFLHGALTFCDGGVYQPYALLVSDGPDGPNETPTKVQFAYYKDLRPDGRLKSGHGPGGTPVLDIAWVRDLLGKLDALGCNAQF
jgi:hypothetical protein